MHNLEKGYRSHLLNESQANNVYSEWHHDQTLQLTNQQLIAEQAFFFYVKFKFSNDTSHIIDLSLANTACAPCMLGTPYKFGYCLRCIITNNNNNVIQTNSFTGISFIKKLAVISPYFCKFSCTLRACFGTSWACKCAFVWCLDY